MTTETGQPPTTLTVDLVAQIWRDHASCNWVSDGVNVRWTCGIIHPGKIHMQPTTRDRHFAALMVTQIEAERLIARRAEQQRFLEAARKRLDEAAVQPTPPAQAEAVAAVEATHRREWADYIEHWEGAVGPEPPTVRTIVALLRSDHLPFGTAAALAPADTGEGE